MLALGIGMRWPGGYRSMTTLFGETGLTAPSQSPERGVSRNALADPTSAIACVQLGNAISHGLRVCWR